MSAQYDTTGIITFYQQPEQSRDGLLWLCFVHPEGKWGIFTRKECHLSKDLGYRWDKKYQGIMVMNRVSHLQFSSIQMIEELAGSYGVSILPELAEV